MKVNLSIYRITKSRLFRLMSTGFIAVVIGAFASGLSVGPISSNPSAENLSRDSLAQDESDFDRSINKAETYVYSSVQSGLAGKVVGVATFGALPDDNIDDTLAIRKAIASTKTTGGTVEFEKGVYNISGQDDKGYDSLGERQYFAPIFQLNNYNNLHIKGSNTLFEAKNWATVFAASDSTDIKISGLTLDWTNDLPFTAGEVTARSADYVDLQVLEGHRATDVESVEFYSEWDFARKRPKPNGFRYRQDSSAPGCKSLDSSKVRCSVSMSSDARELKPGAKVLATFKKNGFNFLSLRRTDGVELDSVNLYSMPGLLVGGAGRNANIRITNTRVIPPPNSPRVMSTSAGATNFSSTQHRGSAVFDNVVFKSMGDDGMNIGSPILKVIKVASSGELTLAKANSAERSIFPDNSGLPFLGDRLGLSRTDTPLVEYSKVRVISARHTNSGGYVVSVAHNGSRVDVKPGDIVVNYSAAPTNTTINRYRSGNNHGRGAVVHSSNVLITNSIFGPSSGPSLIIDASIGVFAEGPIPSSVYVYGNTFNGGNDGRNVSKESSVYVSASINGSAIEQDIISDIYICNNQFNRTRRAAIYAEVSSGAVSNNLFDSLDPVILKGGIVEQSQKCPDFEYAPYISSTLTALDPILPVSMQAIEYRGSSKINCQSASKDDSRFRLINGSDQSIYLALRSPAQSGEFLEVCVRTVYSETQVRERAYKIKF